MATAKAKLLAFKVPKLPAQAADMLYTLRQQRLALQKQCDALEAQEAQLKEYLIDTLPKGMASGVRGQVASVYIESKEIATVSDWDALQAYVRKNNAFFLLPRSVNSAACLEVINAKKKLPGVAKGFVPVVRVNKV
jgi:hypothetical protein